jgi:hypothetical protein
LRHGRIVELQRLHDKVGTPGFDFDLKTCFQFFTSFAGMRACDIANPCRDDYICVAPISPRPRAEIDRIFRERLQRLQSTSPQNPWLRIIGAPYDPDQYAKNGLTMRGSPAMTRVVFAFRHISSFSFVRIGTLVLPRRKTRRDSLITSRRTSK